MLHRLSAMGLVVTAAVCRSFEAVLHAQMSQRGEKTVVTVSPALDFPAATEPPASRPELAVKKPGPCALKNVAPGIYIDLHGNECIRNYPTGVDMLAG